ncbi:AraC family transcriptional regulator [Prauserella rugosa]|uniref:AraC-like DNA-binding protein n=1 Tax=Prauserella rugosa TaxID=43354 RepID=A0A660CHL0_9PSEU|nr:AraC family transcriptional regulator [Prauserella rugosa]KMS65962.1 AraC family transcriptional regulator [Streptomyces regensis]TWH22846.1 AraC-like DNA-binding protein [Prauserella rugosa]
MDALADVLAGVRARSAAFCRTVLEPPWALRIDDGARLALVTMVRGHAWIVPDAGSGAVQSGIAEPGIAEPVLIGEGTVAVVKGPGPYVVADEIDTPASVVVRPGNRLTTVDGTDITDEFLTAAAESETPGSSVMVSGTYQVAGDVGARLLGALPDVALVAAADIGSPVLDLLIAELAGSRPGQQVVLDRLLDLALIETVRTWLDGQRDAAPGWFRAQSDPVVGQALRLIHDDPGAQWTVARLAAHCGVSRAAFARRFTDLVGSPPMAYLADWRMTVAADLLRTTGDTAESVARKVGYANAFAFSAAFKRHRGLSPREHRVGVE